MENQESIYVQLQKKIQYAKASFPYSTRELLHEVIGMAKMAHQLNTITTEEYLTLDHECIYEGLNNPKFFYNMNSEVRI